jgi:hypothetical protein
MIKIDLELIKKVINEDVDDFDLLQDGQILCYSKGVVVDELNIKEFDHEVKIMNSRKTKEKHD